jgi:NitT/TauT family transport system substrate-binding protein
MNRPGGQASARRWPRPVITAIRAAAAVFALAVVVAGVQFGPAAAEAPTIRAGVLSWGTVNWELDVVKHHRLDEKRGVRLEVSKLGGKGASAVALQAGAVDAIVTDWIWVSRRRHAGADYTFVPHSLAVGGLMVRPDSGIESIADLKGRKIGIAGGPVDKSWILLRAYAAKTAGLDISDAAEPVFAAPPLLNQVMLRGEVPAVLNFWHYNARLKAAGMIELMPVSAMLPALGVKRTPPLLGWVFSEAWAAANPKAIAGFLDSLRDAKRIMAESDAEWERLRPLTKAKDDVTFAALRDAYRAGMPKSFGDEDVAASRRIFETLARHGGAKLVGEAKSLAPGTFWAKYRY